MLSLISYFCVLFGQMHVFYRSSFFSKLHCYIKYHVTQDLTALTQFYPSPLTLFSVCHFLEDIFSKVGVYACIYLLYPTTDPFFFQRVEKDTITYVVLLFKVLPPNYLQRMWPEADLGRLPHPRWSALW